MEMDRDFARKVAYSVIAIFVIALVSYSLSNRYIDSQNGINESNGNLVKDATCDEVESKLDSRLGDQANCTCYKATSKEDEMDVPESVKEKADLYTITCSFPDGKKYYPVWLVTDNATQTN